MRNLITNKSANADLLLKPAKRVKNPQATEVILGIQEMKRIATEWEHETGHMCEGLAATQIGWDARVIILRKSNARMPKKPVMADFYITPTNGEGEVEFDAETYEQVLNAYNDWMRRFASTFDPWHVLINPQVMYEDGSQDSVEACLSLPGSSYKVKRPEVMFFKYRKPNNKMSAPMAVRGKDAAALQHEIDHTKGILLNHHALEAYVGEESLPL